MSYEKFNELESLAGDYAKAEADRLYLAEFRKTKKALLMKEYESKHPGAAVSAQEREAYAHPEYLEVIEGLKEATEKALKIKFDMEVVKIKFETWRTKQATIRAEMNLQ